jgi:hypothetical protein
MAAAPNMDCQALARALVDQVQQSHRPSVMGESAHEIVCPDMVAVLWPQAHAGAVVEPKPPAWLLLLRHLQTLAAPDSLYAILAHLPARLLELDGDTSISIPAIRAGQRDDGPGQRVFVVPLCGPIALRATWLMNQLARMSLTCPMLFGMLHSECGAAPGLEVSPRDVLKDLLVQAELGDQPLQLAVLLFQFL